MNFSIKTLGYFLCILALSPPSVSVLSWVLLTSWKQNGGSSTRSDICTLHHPEDKAPGSQNTAVCSLAYAGSITYPWTNHWWDRWDYVFGVNPSQASRLLSNVDGINLASGKVIRDGGKHCTSHMRSTLADLPKTWFYQAGRTNEGYPWVREPILKVRRVPEGCEVINGTRSQEILSFPLPWPSQTCVVYWKGALASKSGRSGFKC